MLTGGIGDETGVLLLSGDMWIKRNSLPQRVTPSHTLTQCHNSIYLIDTKVKFYNYRICTRIPCITR